MGALLVNHKSKQGYSPLNMTSPLETNQTTNSESTSTSVPLCDPNVSQQPEDNPDFATIYIVSQIVLFIIRKCWKTCGLSVLVLIIIYWYCGILIALLIFIVGISGLFYQVSDWLLYHPEQPSHSRIYVPSPSIFNLPSENFHIRTNDGLMINTIFVKQDQAVFSQVPTILMFHGNAGNIGHRLPIVHGLYQICGCNVLLCEYRGYGRSEGTASEAGFYLDAQAALDYLLQYPGIDHEKIIVFGQSLGGAVAIDVASRFEYRKRILLIIIENTFTSIPDMAKVLFNSRIVRFLPLWCFKNQFRSSGKVNNVFSPALFISGLADSLIPPYMMEELYKLCGSHMKRLVSFESGTHNETWQCHGYFRTLGLFIDDVILFMYDQKRTGCGLSSCNLGCPAPRSPENGLSFIFRSGRLVKYSCHPGFTLIGHAQAECLNNQWNQAVPECVAGPNRPSISGPAGTNSSSVVVRPLFEWESSNQNNQQQQMYGEGARRLPLINGIWDKTRRGQDNRTTDALVNQEINIASVRHRQQQEVRRSRLHDAPSEWRQQQLAEARRRPDTLYARSRSASSYHRGRYDHVSQEVTTTTTTPRPVSRRRDVTASPVRTIGLHDRDLSELRLRQIEEVQRSRMGGHHQTNADKSGIVDNYRRSQYNYYQTVHGSPGQHQVVGPPVTYVRRPVVEGPLIYSNELPIPSVFSQEKAGQVETTFRNYFPGDYRRPLYGVGPPVIAPTRTSTPPRSTPKRPEATISPTWSTPRQPFSRSTPKRTEVTIPPTWSTPRPPLPPATPKRPLPTTPPPRRQPLLPTEEVPRAPASSEKAAQAEDTLLDQYLRAEHMRRILELERTGGAGRRAAVSTEDEMRQRINTLSSMVSGVDVEWLNRLSPELQLRYLQEVLVSRGKEARDGRAAEEFLRRHS